MPIILRLLALVTLMLPAQAALAAARNDAPAPDATLLAPAVDPANVWVLNLDSGGAVRILLRPDIAPGTVDRIKTLTRAGFYNGIAFHRVIPGFMAQGGDPKGDGTGGSDLPDLKAEFNKLPHLRGTVSMARTEAPDTANSQFFIMFAPMMSIDGRYTVFGRVISGMEHVDAVSVGEPPRVPTRIVSARIEGDSAGVAPDARPADPLVD